MSPHFFKQFRYRASNAAFTLIELMVVTSVIILVSGMTIPAITRFFDNQKLPRGAKVLATYIRNAQVTAVNYLMSTQIELVPGTDNEVRSWGQAAVIKYPTTGSINRDWDRADSGYILISEARRMSKSGGTVRLLPLNPYSKEPQNAEDFASLSGNFWEFSELKYTHYSLKEYERAGGFTEVTVALDNLTFENGTARDASHKIPIDHEVGVQTLIGAARQLPRGVGIDPVNYVTYSDTNGDGMPDGNPLCLSADRNSGRDNPFEPLVLANRGDTVPKAELYADLSTFKPRHLSAGLMFSREGTLKRSLSLCYNAKDPADLNVSYFSSNLDANADASVYGFVVYDKSSPDKRMMVAVTGTGQVQQPYAVYPPDGMHWGENW